MSWQSDVANGLAQLLATAGIGTWDPDGRSGNITRGAIPPNICPAIGIQTYRIGADDPAHPTTRLRVQFWLRAADIDSLDDLDAAIYDHVLGLADIAFGVATVSDTNSISTAPMGPDEQGNPERACSYYLDLDLPDTALRSYARN